tara:strand:- start:290 stop:538 length:249 start_codon:yes stop_codon:yes gene_type:complete
MDLYHDIIKKEQQLKKLQLQMTTQWKELIEVKIKVLEVDNKNRPFLYHKTTEYIEALDSLIEWTTEAIHEEGQSMAEEYAVL